MIRTGKNRMNHGGKMENIIVITKNQLKFGIMRTEIKNMHHGGKMEKNLMITTNQLRFGILRTETKFMNHGGITTCLKFSIIRTE